jgi:hypothetical protein
MIYIANKNGQAVCRSSADTLRVLDGVEPELTITDAEFSAAHEIARIINGEIFLGLTEEEELKRQNNIQIAGYKRQLEQIDQESGASRPVRDISVSAGVVLDAVRILLSRFAAELDIKLPIGFGSGAASAEDILSLSPASNATEKEKADFAMYKALLLVSHFDPAINPGLTIIREAEIKAKPIREELDQLLDSEKTEEEGND